MISFRTQQALTLAGCFALLANMSCGFSTRTMTIRIPLISTNYPRKKSLSAKPKRLADNEEGVLYVNDRCINCAACSYFAPKTFTRSSSGPHHIVYNQPICTDADMPSDDFLDARAALAACPVGAIRSTTQAEIVLASSSDTMGEASAVNEHVEISKAFSINPKFNGIPLPFPRALSPNVWMVGHHSEKTFGAVPYLVKGRHRGKVISVLVDVPKFSKSAIQTVEDLCSSSSSSSPLEKGPDYMFLTHVDDTAQHLDWKERFPNMKRIFHSGDLGEHNWVGDESLEDVEILLHGSSDVANGELRAFSLDGATTDTIMKTHEGGDAKEMLLDVYQKVDSDFIILHTPGHSPGSISLLHKLDGGTIFTGDTYSYTTRGRGHMTGFPRYGNDLPLQARTLECLGGLAGAYDCIASGHGHPRNYRESDESADAIEDWKRTDIEDATSELRSYFK